ncbi:MAG: CRISPR-associated endonuclease/helicase Cas3 [Thermotogota bacterium]|jgi:CRISPR-associated helicase Cas3|nr:MAG: CRISPR-associated helicase, Cas3 family [bacterium 42_11]MDK2864852.1 CRISPR-associated endonuclease/helicase Cas3 [Thermotogota bacterium]HBT25679.1 type I-D CRISPR-associated helicase Cas3' [Pseudothermotoga sp.]HCZ07028.1 type I-D CRISPR-associated helicase Cas3' [Thermotogota bacterium]
MKLLGGYSIPVEWEENVLWAKHQLDTYRALQDHDIVINTYPTGSGKTLALLNAIRKLEIRRALIIAPINQLIYQYSESVKRFVEKYDLSHKVVTVTSESLDVMKKPHSRALRDILDEFSNIIAISNPDIVHYVIMQMYSKKTLAGDLLVKLLRFPQLVAFDEFHYYDLSRIFFMTVMLASSKHFGLNQKFVFMTATPNEEILKIFDKLGMSYKIVSLSQDGDLQPVSSPLKIELLFGKLNDHTDEIIRILKENPESDILVISNSLKRIAYLASLARRKGLNFGMVTGPMNAEDRKLALEKRIVLATPTVDIGYDFSRPTKDRQSIDIVIFEALSHDQFVQRLGRVGRIFGKPKNDVPSTAYPILPDYLKNKALETLEGSKDRLQLNDAMESVFKERFESLKREYMGPQRILVGLYEDAFKLIFPEEKTGDFVKEMLDNYYKLLESVFDFRQFSRIVRRAEIDFYYFSKHLEQGEEELAIRILERNQQLKDEILEKYASEEELLTAAKLYRKFIEEQILSFRPGQGRMVYVLDEKKITGAREFLYDEISVLTQYVVEPLPFEEIPPIYKNEVRKGFRLIEPSEQKVKLSLEIRTGAKRRFFIPVEMKTHQHFSGYGALKFNGFPVYLLDDPKLRQLSHAYDFHPVKAMVNGIVAEVLIGSEAIKAQSYFEEKPWGGDLFPV